MNLCLQATTGRWTSPDPYNGSMNIANPQSFNRYSYVENQPTNFVDPSGLLRIQQCRIDWWTVNGEKVYGQPYNCRVVFDDGGGGGGGGSARKGDNKGEKANKNNLKARFDKCVKELFGDGVSARDSGLGTVVSIPGRSNILVSTDFNLSGAEVAKEIGQTGRQSGATPDRAPDRTYIAKEVFEDPKYKSNVGFMALFIHEIGNAIAGLRYNNAAATSSPDYGKDIPFISDPRWKSIIEKYAGKNYDGHVDAGMALEACIFKGQVGLRTGRVGTSREF